MKHPIRLEPVIDTVYRLVPVRPVRRLPDHADETALREMLTANPAHFAAREALADRFSASGRVGEACQLRLDGCRLVSDLLDETDDEFVTLDWEDPYTALALAMVYDSAEDHFVIGDFEMAAAMLELLADRDPEDHQNGTALLTFCYGALEEWELFDETAAMLAPEAPATRLARYWGDFRRDIPGVRETMRRDDPVLFREWTATSHEMSSEIQHDFEPSRLAKTADARRLWLRTESLWRAFPEFADYLRG